MGVVGEERRARRTHIFCPRNRSLFPHSAAHVVAHGGFLCHRTIPFCGKLPEGRGTHEALGMGAAVPKAGLPLRGRGSPWGLHPQGLGGLMGQLLPLTILPWLAVSLAGIRAPQWESNARAYGWGRWCLFTPSLSRFILLSHALTLIFSLIPLAPILILTILMSTPACVVTCE